MKTAKRILTIAAVAGILLTSIYSILFTTAEIPASLVQPTPNPRSQEKYKALVLKWFSPEKLKPGTLVLVEINDGTTSTRKIGKLERIQFPKPSQRMKASGRHRALAQA